MTGPRQLSINGSNGVEAVGSPAAAETSMAKLARGGTVNLLGAAVTAVCTFALTVVIARGVSRAEAGVFFSVTSLFLVATTIGQLGTNTALVYFVSRCRALGRPELVSHYLRAALRPLVVVAVAMMIIMLVLARPLATITSPKHVDEATEYLRILAVFIPVAGVETALLAATRGVGSMRASALIEQIARPLAQVLLVGIAIFAASAAKIGIAWSIGYLPAAGAAWVAWRAARSPTAAHGKTVVNGAATFREFWRFALPRSLTSVIQMLMQRFDIVLVGALAGAVDAAIYAAATRFIVLGQLGTNALTLAAQPQFAERLAAGDHSGANKLYQISTAWLMLVTWPIYLTLIIFARPLLRVFGHGYAAGQVVVVLIAASMLLATGLGMVDTVLAMGGRTSWNLGNAVLALSTNIGLDLWLIPRHGIVGAAIGWAVAIAVRNLAAVTLVWLSLRYQPVARATSAAAALCVLCYVGVLGMGRLFLGATYPGLLFGLAIASGCFLSGLWLLRSPLQLDAFSILRRRRSQPAATPVP